MANKNLKNDYKNINLNEMIQQYKTMCYQLEYEESIMARINKIKVECESELIGIATDILSNIKLYDEYEEETTVGIEYNDDKGRWEIELNSESLF